MGKTCGTESYSYLCNMGHPSDRALFALFIAYMKLQSLPQCILAMLALTHSSTAIGPLREA